MSVRPINFLPNGDIEVVYDELGHQGNILANEIRWTSDPISGENHNYILLACPDGCGASSTHPVGGGADAPNVQELFVRKVSREGCICPAMKDQPATFSTAVEHVKNLVTAMDGPERWQLDDQRLQAMST